MAAAAVDTLVVTTEAKGLWVPNTFAQSGKIYLLSGTHRGDMYHVRGAMILEPHPLLVYEPVFNPRPEDSPIGFYNTLPHILLYPTPTQKAAGPPSPPRRAHHPSLTTPGPLHRSFKVRKIFFSVVPALNAQHVAGVFPISFYF